MLILNNENFYNDDFDIQESSKKLADILVCKFLKGELL